MRLVAVAVVTAMCGTARGGDVRTGEDQWTGRGRVDGTRGGERRENFHPDTFLSDSDVALAYSVSDLPAMARL